SQFSHSLSHTALAAAGSVSYRSRNERTQLACGLPGLHNASSFARMSGSSRPSRSWQAHITPQILSTRSRIRCSRASPRTTASRDRGHVGPLAPGTSPPGPAPPRTHLVQSLPTVGTGTIIEFYTQLEIHKGGKLDDRLNLEVTCAGS